MQVQALFKKDIFRPINGVVKADQLDESTIWQELDEFVVTKELDKHLRRFFSTYVDSIDHSGNAEVTGNIGVWMSGFFGSGKSHFIKILSYLLKNDEHQHDGESKKAVEFFESKVKDAMLFADIKRAYAVGVHRNISILRDPYTATPKIRFYGLARLGGVAWDYQAAQVQLGNGERRDIFLWGLPPDSQIFRPRIVSGRGLRPDDDLAILLNRKTATDMGIRPGDRMKLVIGERESSWTVVGLVLNLNNNQRDSFVPLRALAREALTPDQATVVMAQGEQHDAANQQALAKALRAAYAARKFDIDFVESASEMQAQNRALFNVITYLMLSMAAVAAVVSSIGLMGAMSLNVIERRREIGVLRAVGATSAAIVGIFVTEGVLVGLLSWLLAVPLSHPSARLFSRMISNVMIPLDFSYSTTGMLLWLAIVVVLSIVASLWPALRATRISVRESLSYE